MRTAPAGALETDVRAAVGASPTGCGCARSTARKRGDSSVTIPETVTDGIVGGSGSRGGFMVSPVVTGVSNGGADRNCVRARKENGDRPCDETPIAFLPSANTFPVASMSVAALIVVRVETSIAYWDKESAESP